MPEHTSREVRDALVQAIERSYHSGATAGQIWLHDLSAYLQALPLDDHRLSELTDRYDANGVEDYLHQHAQPLVSHLNPSAWLDDYTNWQTRPAQPN